MVGGPLNGTAGRMSSAPGRSDEGTRTARGEAVAATHEAGIGVESEAGGPGPPIHQVPVDALKAQGALDEVRGEFWPHRPDAHALWVVKETLIKFWLLLILKM